MSHHAAFDAASLHVYTLGRFVAERDGVSIPSSAWNRDKALQLFQFLLTQRRRLMERERIVERLWPEQSAEAGERDFKVALAGLLKAIEPERAARAESRFIRRAGTAYGLESGETWVDAQALEAAIAEGNRSFSSDVAEAAQHYREAAELYTGEFLPDRRYEDWASAEQERFQTLALGAMANLAALVLDSNPLESLHLAGRIIEADPLWEEAWRLEMRAHLARGNRALALRAFERCKAVLDRELGIGPLPDTVAVIDAAMQREKRPM